MELAKPFLAKGSAGDNGLHGRLHFLAVANNSAMVYNMRRLKSLAFCAIDGLGRNLESSVKSPRSTGCALQWAHFLS